MIKCPKVKGFWFWIAYEYWTILSGIQVMVKTRKMPKWYHTIRNRTKNVINPMVTTTFQYPNYFSGIQAMVPICIINWNLLGNQMIPVIGCPVFECSLYCNSLVFKWFKTVWILIGLIFRRYLKTGPFCFVLFCFVLFCFVLSWF
jgi:hypothetical protein